MAEKAEPIENLHQPLCTFKCRKFIMFIMYKCLKHDLKFLYDAYLRNGGHLLIFFIIANANIPFSKCKFSIGSFFPSPHHFIFGSVSTFKNDDVSMLKIFTHVHLCVMKGYICQCTANIQKILEVRVC